MKAMYIDRSDDDEPVDSQACMGPQDSSCQIITNTTSVLGLAQHGISG